MEIQLSDVVSLTVNELILVATACVMKDRVERPEQIDYSEYVKGFLYKEPCDTGE